MTPSSLPSPESEKKSSLPSRGAVPHLPDGVTTDARENHDTRVKHIAAGYVVECAVCGRVGVEQDTKADAYAIADRHTEIGGFG